MLRKIVVGYDFSDHADDALAWATDLARALGSQVALAHVTEADSPDNPDVEALRHRLAAVADNVGPEVASHVLVGSDIAETIVRFADQIDADAIVVGTRGLGSVARLFLGSVADGVLRKAACPVITFRHED